MPETASITNATNTVLPPKMSKSKADLSASSIKSLRLDAAHKVETMSVTNTTSVVIPPKMNTSKAIWNAFSIMSLRLGTAHELEIAYITDTMSIALPPKMNIMSLRLDIFRPRYWRGLEGEGEGEGESGVEGKGEYRVTGGVFAESSIVEDP